MKIQFIARTKLPVLALLALSTAACSTQPPELKLNSGTAQAVQVPIGDNSQNALDWDGSYSGITPCASCEGIQTLVTLKRDNSYILESVYLGRNDKRFIEQGKFEWHSNGSRITLKPEPAHQQAGKQFLVGENQLFMLDIAGERITGGLADSYRLIKIKPAN